MLLAALVGPAPALGADPVTLKDTLGKVQSEASSKAVDDLIEKLRQPARKSPAARQPGGSPAAPPPAATTPAATSSSNDAPAPAPSTPPPTTNPDTPTETAGAQGPSLDVEVFFAYKSTGIGPETAAALEPLGRALSDPRLAADRFLIVGHTDAKGSAEYNLALSRQRADAVRRHLVANFGIDGGKLTAQGMGKHPGDPLSAANRRVQIVNLSRGHPR